MARRFLAIAGACAAIALVTMSTTDAEAGWRKCCRCGGWGGGCGFAGGCGGCGFSRGYACGFSGGYGCGDICGYPAGGYYAGGYYASRSTGTRYPVGEYYSSGSSGDEYRIIGSGYSYRPSISRTVRTDSGTGSSWNLARR